MKIFEFKNKNGGKIYAAGRNILHAIDNIFIFMEKKCLDEGVDFRKEMSEEEIFQIREALSTNFLVKESEVEDFVTIIN